MTVKKAICWIKKKSWGKKKLHFFPQPPTERLSLCAQTKRKPLTSRTVACQWSASVNLGQSTHSLSAALWANTQFSFDSSKLKHRNKSRGGTECNLDPNYPSIHIVKAGWHPGQVTTSLPARSGPHRDKQPSVSEVSSVASPELLPPTACRWGKCWMCAGELATVSNAVRLE